MNNLDTARNDITDFLNHENNSPDDYEGTCSQLLFHYDTIIVDELAKHYDEYNITSIEFIDSHGGEGEGNQFWHILKIEHNNGTIALVKLDGYYASYSGSDYSDWFFVKPIQVMVTQYVKDE